MLRRPFLARTRAAPLGSPAEAAGQEAAGQQDELGGGFARRTERPPRTTGPSSTTDPTPARQGDSNSPTLELTDLELTGDHQKDRFAVDAEVRVSNPSAEPEGTPLIRRTRKTGTPPKSPRRRGPHAE